MFKIIKDFFRRPLPDNDELYDEPVTTEQIERKERSISILKKEKVPYIDWLPVIESESQSLRRNSEEILRRAIALSIVYEKSRENDQEFVLSIIEKFNCTGDFTPEEHEFIYNINPSEQAMINASWRIECVYLLLWSLGVFKLIRPETEVHTGDTIAPLASTPYEKLLDKTSLRPQSEILDQADLIYRYHWATKNADLRNDPIPAKLNHSVVMERHRALNWLIGAEDQDWDDITLDT